MTSCYKKLANKKNLIEKICMDPITLDFVYLDSEGELVPKESLSAGEKQLMVISMLWALGICSKKKLPVIIDTPLSRLDSNHRISLITTYFPQASDQTIILSTDSEIDGHYYGIMKENVGDEFTLVYDDEKKEPIGEWISSSIQMTDNIASQFQGKNQIALQVRLHDYVVYKNIMGSTILSQDVKIKALKEDYRTAYLQLTASDIILDGEMWYHLIQYLGV